MLWHVVHWACVWSLLRNTRWHMCCPSNGRRWIPRRCRHARRPRRCRHAQRHCIDTLADRWPMWRLHHQHFGQHTPRWRRLRKRQRLHHNWRRRHRPCRRADPRHCARRLMRGLARADLLQWRAHHVAEQPVGLALQVFDLSHFHSVCICASSRNASLFASASIRSCPASNRLFSELDALRQLR